MQESRDGTTASLYDKAEFVGGFGGNKLARDSKLCVRAENRTRMPAETNLPLCVAVQGVVLAIDAACVRLSMCPGRFPPRAV